MKYLPSSMAVLIRTVGSSTALHVFKLNCRQDRFQPSVAKGVNLEWQLQQLQGQLIPHSEDVYFVRHTSYCCQSCIQRLMLFTKNGTVVRLGIHEDRLYPAVLRIRSGFGPDPDSIFKNRLDPDPYINPFQKLLG
jgi:hypothetical protein